MAIEISNRQARRVILHLQGLSRPPHQPQSAADLYELIVQLGFVQVDSIQWVERAHHMILFSRNQNYRPEHLHRSIEQDQTLFENYTHDASVIPSEYFPYWKHRFERSRDRLRQRMTNWQGGGFLDHCDALLQLIETSGPIRSRDLDRPKNKKSKEMWQWDDGKAALEFLWRTGELSICARDGFQKVYDLSSRVIPEKHFRATCSHEAFIDWACRGALDRLGFASPSDIARYWNLVSIAEVRQWIDQQENQIKQVLVSPADGSKPRQLIARGDIEQLVTESTKPPPRMRVLSPFDPVIRDRNRLLWLFDFDYRIEIYVPAAKRKYGYYVFPLLEGERLVGRIDMRADRKEDCLQVRRVWSEIECPWSQARQKRFEQELRRQAKLAKVSRIRCPKSVVTPNRVGT